MIWSQIASKNEKRLPVVPYIWRGRFPGSAMRRTTDLRLKPVLTSGVTRQGDRRVRRCSTRIETPHGTLVFTGDTGSSDAVDRLANGADVLITEVEDLGQITRFVSQMAEQNHWPPERAAGFTARLRREHMDEQDVGQMAAGAHTKSVVLYTTTPSTRLLM